MELIEGLGLDRLIRSRSVQTGQAFGYLDGILNGLQAMHEAGVGHLDVKPSNVILRNGNTPVLVDFGLSGRHVRPGCGTVEYCAPEILGVTPKGVLPSPAACDLYSFGCTAFELLTGKLLFDAEDEMELLSAHLSHDGWPGNLMNLGRFPEFYELSVVLAACLRRDPRQRAGLAETRAALSVVASRIGTMAWPLRAPADA
jgi:serine/threonine protein kinase